MDILIVLSSGLFTQGGEPGLPSYTLCMCDIPNLATGLELALGREGLMEEDGRSDGIRFQVRHRSQPWLLPENRRESEHRGEELMALPMCEQCILSSSLGKQAGLGEKATPHSHPNIYTPTREGPTPFFLCVLAPSGKKERN